MFAIIFILYFLGLIALDGTPERYFSGAQSVTPSDQTSIRVVDLHLISKALEKYKKTHRQYPISSEPMIGWDGLYSAYGESKFNWIDGLVPLYIHKLPRDPRMNENPMQQYFYTSDGANYKLISHAPDDCEKVMVSYPELIDPQRGCGAYGFWTRPAMLW